MRDLGLQPERTTLAWSRTLLLMIADAMLLVRAGVQHQAWPVLACGVLLCGAAALLMIPVWHRGDALATGRHAPHRWLMRCCSGCVVVAAIVVMTAVMAGART